MEMTLQQIAASYHCSVRSVQLAVADETLSVHRQVGRSLIVDDIAALAWSRATSRGRRWSTRMRDAALDLLSEGKTAAVQGPEKSRLKRRLAMMTARDVAYASGGLGRWARYREYRPIHVPGIGPSAIASEELGIVSGAAPMRFGSAPDLTEFAVHPDLALDADGQLGIVERPERDDRIARVLLDTYLLGDARMSVAAAGLLEERVHGL
ncbi:MAG: hypothetical protein CSA64_04840 [Arachnia propionica]|nr:MAG: hypothetical protein CSA64_04840 [Arachnia propionica]